MITALVASFAAAGVAAGLAGRGARGGVTRSRNGPADVPPGARRARSPARRLGRDPARHRLAGDVLVALAGELRAGRAGPDALAGAALAAGPLRPAIEDAALAAVTGSAPRELARVAASSGVDALGTAALAWEVAQRTGGRVADVLDRLAAAADAEEEAAAEVAAALAGPRATAVVLAALPLLGVLLGQSIGAHPARLLLHRPVGLALLAVGAVLDTLGLLWTARIVRGALRP